MPRSVYGGEELAKKELRRQMYHLRRDKSAEEKEVAREDDKTRKQSLRQDQFVEEK